MFLFIILRLIYRRCFFWNRRLWYGHKERAHSPRLGNAPRLTSVKKTSGYAALSIRSCAVCSFFCTLPSMMALNFFSSSFQLATF